MATYSRNATGLKGIINSASNNIYSLQVSRENGSSGSSNALIVFGTDNYLTTYPTDEEAGGDITSLFATASNDMDIFFVKNTRKYDYCQFPSGGGAGKDEAGSSFTGVGGFTSKLNTIISSYTKVNFIGLGVSGNFGALEQSMLVTANKLYNVILTMNLYKIPSSNVTAGATTTIDISASTKFNNASNYIFKGVSDFSIGTGDIDGTDQTIIEDSVIDDSTLTTLNGYDNVTVQTDLQDELPTLLKSFS